MELIITNNKGWACTNIAYLDFDYEIAHKNDIPKRVEKITGENVYFVDSSLFKEGDSVKCVFKDTTGVVGVFGTIDVCGVNSVKISIRRRIEDYKSILETCK